jgi:hypothetical protein
MTVKLLVSYRYGGVDYAPLNLLTADAGTESGLIASKLAESNLTGGTTYVAPTAPESVDETHIAAFARDSSGNVVGLVAPGGGVIYMGNYAYTWATKPSAAGNTNQVIFISDVGVGGGSHWRSDGTNWRPVGGSVLLGMGSGSIATPIQAITGNTGAVFTSAQTAIPAGLLIVGAQIELWAHVKRVGANGTGNFNACIGTSGTASDANILGFGLAATTNLEYVPCPMVDVPNATTVSSTAYLQIGGGTGAGASNENTANFNIASAMQLSFYTSSANALDSFNLIKYRVIARF